LKRSAALSLLLALIASAAPLAAHPGHATPEQTPEATVDAFHRALAAGHREEALALLAPDAVIFESGGAEMSRDEYANHHLAADMEFSAAAPARVLDRKQDSGGDTAWVLSRTEAKGSFRGREVHSRGTETMLLRQTAAGWRIVHIHWSSQAVAKD
jgi:ketosteroid isomerase-like protein